MTKLVMQLLQRIPGSAPDEDAVRMQVRNFKTQVDSLLPKLADAHNLAAKEAVDDTSVLTLFEEVKIMFQDLPSRVESRLSDGFEPGRRMRLRRFHPMMFEEFDAMMGEPGGPIGLLLLVSMFRDEFPPIYEVGMEAYRALSSGNPAKAEASMERLRRLSEFIAHGPFMKEMGYSSKEMHMMFMELPHFLDRINRRYREPKTIRKKESLEAAKE